MRLKFGKTFSGPREIKDLPAKICHDPSHNPPTDDDVRAGGVYEHCCPSCGYKAGRKDQDMTEELLQRLTPEEREAWAMCQKATPGPWNTEINSSMVFVGSAGKLTHNTVLEADVDSFVCNVGSAYFEEEWEEVKNRAAFIARSRTALPDALRKLAELREAVDEAPHGLGCSTYTWSVPRCHNCDMTVLGHIEGRCLNPLHGQDTQWVPILPPACNCWKSRLPK